MKGGAGADRSLESCRAPSSLNSPGNPRQPPPAGESPHTLSGRFGTRFIESHDESHFPCDSEA